METRAWAELNLNAELVFELRAKNIKVNIAGAGNHHSALFRGYLQI
jgi:hypothetical protein